MGVNQQQSTNDTDERGNVIELLQPSIEQGNTNSNTSVDSDFDASYAVDTRILRRSKRNSAVVAGYTGGKFATQIKTIIGATVEVVKRNELYYIPLLYCPKDGL